MICSPFPCPVSTVHVLSPVSGQVALCPLSPLPTPSNNITPLLLFVFSTQSRNNCGAALRCVQSQITAVHHQTRLILFCSELGKPVVFTNSLDRIIQLLQNIKPIHGKWRCHTVLVVELQKNLCRDFTIMEKAFTRAFSWSKVPTSAYQWPSQ